MSMFAKHVITLTYVACHANYTENRMRATPNVTAHQIATGMRLLNLWQSECKTDPAWTVR